MNSRFFWNELPGSILGRDVDASRWNGLPHVQRNCNGEEKEGRSKKKTILTSETEKERVAPTVACRSSGHEYPSLVLASVITAPNGLVPLAHKCSPFLEIGASYAFFLLLSELNVLRLNPFFFVLPGSLLFSFSDFVPFVPRVT